MNVSECPGGCAVNNVCGSETECDVAAVAAIVVVSIVSLACVIGCMCVLCKTCKKVVKKTNKMSHYEPLIKEEKVDKVEAKVETYDYEQSPWQ